MRASADVATCPDALPRIATRWSKSQGLTNRPSARTGQRFGLAWVGSGEVAASTNTTLFGVGPDPSDGLDDGFVVFTGSAPANATRRRGAAHALRPPGTQRVEGADGGRGDVLPRPPSDRLLAGGEQCGSVGVVGQRADDRRCDRRRVVRVEAGGRFVEHLGQGGQIRADRRHAAGCRFEHGQSEPLLERRHDRQRRPLQHGDQFVVVERPGEDHPVADADLVGAALPIGGARRGCGPWRSRGDAGWPDAASASAQARIRPSVFLRSSPPVTATTYGPTSEGITRALRGRGSAVGGANFASTPAPIMPIRERGKSNSVAAVSAANSEIASRASTVRASGARSCAWQRALGSTW